MHGRGTRTACFGKGPPFANLIGQMAERFRWVTCRASLGAGEEESDLRSRACARVFLVPPKSLLLQLDSTPPSPSMSESEFDQRPFVTVNE